MERPKYYIGRSVLIYLLTIITGTFIDSIIITLKQSSVPSFWESVLGFGYYGGLITGILCLPIILVLILGFYFIYKKSKSNQQKWKYILLLCFVCCVLPVIVFLFSEFNSLSDPDRYLWLQLMIPYALSAAFYILYLSKRADSINPPEFAESIGELEGILDSGFEDDF